MFITGALAFGVVCGWLSILVSGSLGRAWSTGVFLVLLAVGGTIAYLPALKPILAGIFLGLAMHAAWRLMLVVAVGRAALIGTNGNGERNG